MRKSQILLAYTYLAYRLPYLTISYIFILISRNPCNFPTQSFVSNKLTTKVHGFQFKMNLLYIF